MVVGIIVTDENHLANHPTPLVLDLDVNYRSPRDFHLISVEQMNPIMHAGNEEELELRRKFRPKPLYFGTFLKWSKYEMGNVQTVIYPNDYAIAHDKLFETRVHEGKTQILLTGVVSRDRRVFWTTKFPCLTIPLTLQENVTPDVAITCWVTLQILPDLLLEYKLFEFVNIADDLQHIVRETPWYREADNRNLRSINLHSYQGLDRQPGVRNPMKIQPLEVCGVEAIVISKTDVLVLTNTQTAFKKVVISEKDKLPPVGTSVKINARLLELLGFYAIITFKIENKALKGTHEDKLRVTIKKCPEVPGFVFCEFYGIYLDDPENVLEKWYFSKYSNSGLAVALISGAPSLNGKARYYVAEIIDDKKKKKIEEVKIDEMKFENKIGLVLNRGRVFFCEWPYFDIRISSEEKDKFEIGSVVKVSANFDGTDWKITNIAVDTKVPAFEVKKIQNRKTYYRIPKVHANKYLPNCLFHEIFGMIATPPSFPELIANTHYEFDDVWVALNEVYPGDLIHPQYRFRYVRSGQWDNYEDVERDSLYDFNDDESIISSQSSKRVRFNVPQVSESVEIREDWRTKIDRQVLTISQSEEWRNEPAKKIIAEIDSHCVDCETCRNKRSTEECYFPEIVAQLLRMNTSISRILAERDWFTFVVTRRFTT